MAREKGYKMIKFIVPTAAIIGIVVIEIVALSNGIDGTALAGSMVIIGGIGGYEAKAIRDHYKKK